MKGIYWIILLFSYAELNLFAQQEEMAYPIKTGIEFVDAYLPRLKEKRVGIFCNHTSTFFNGVHLVDSLLKLGIHVTKIYAPEHGFRGDKDAGEHINNDKDSMTGLPIISMYGDKKNLTQQDLDSVDVVIFDIQDMGVRFYTYISSLQYIIKACMRYNKSLLVLDRPNPHLDYIDGPVLRKRFRSFVGMQSVPIVYGMTIGEYALMIVGEEWVIAKRKIKKDFRIEVIPCEEFDRKTLDYQLPIAPSPNLISKTATLLYPSLCFFEGTVVSVGRGTAYPFEVYGHPSFDSTEFDFKFIPQKTKGNKSPLYMNIGCNGEKLVYEKSSERTLHLSWLLRSYQAYKTKPSFFVYNTKEKSYFFDKLAGTNKLRRQIKAGYSEELIRKSWQKGICRFSLVRKKYLMYP